MCLWYSKELCTLILSQLKTKKLAKFTYSCLLVSSKNPIIIAILRAVLNREREREKSISQLGGLLYLILPLESEKKRNEGVHFVNRANAGNDFPSFHLN